MRETLLALYKLQQIDSAALEVAKAAEQYPARIAVIEAELDALRKELGSHHAAYENKLKDQLDTEGQIREDSGKQAKWKRRLNDLKSAREYQMMSREVDHAERALKEQEDKVVTLMGEVESAKKTIDDLTSRLKENEDRANLEIQELREKQARGFAEVERIRQGRAKLLESLPAPLKNRYERVRERRQGVAVALAVEGKCGACNRMIRPQMMVEIRKLISIEECPHCSRILVLDALVLGPASQTEASDR